jgi:hypothetical protein
MRREKLATRFWPRQAGVPFGSAVLLAILLLPVLFAGDAFHKAIPKDERISHALNRLTFGPRPGDGQRVKASGLKKWIDQQLDPEGIPENPVLTKRLEDLDSVVSKALTAERPNLQALPPDSRRLLIARLAGGARSVVAHDLPEGKLLRAIYSHRQLQEVLTDFWFNHFNIYLDKGADRLLLAHYERDVIRPHVLGKFRDLLEATAKSPAMLFYLDNWQSVGANRTRQGNRRGLNENYGRELLELQTLGVDGGYTQKDVTEVARCFTGWTIERPQFGGTFLFNPRMHDQGEKTVLGVTIAAGGGIEDGEKVLDVVARHPATAHFISRELAQRFVADEPPSALVERMAQTFLTTDGDLRAVMQTMLESREFWSMGAYRSKMKSPLELVASAVRAGNGDVDSATALVNQIAQMGEPLYRKQEPTGYSNSSAQWNNSAGLLARLNFAVNLASNKIAGVSVNGVSGIALGSPEFQEH